MNFAISAPGLAILLVPILAFSLTTNEQEIELINKNFVEKIHRKREQSGLVGLSVLVLKDGVVALSASSGERKKGSGIAVTEDDTWHIGSITKSFTSTMIARLIEKEQLHWNTSVGDVFQGEDIHDAWRNVTLEQLLTHTSGAKANFSLFLTFYKKNREGEELSTMREREVLKVLAKRPAEEPGSTFIYSNLGYTIAGTMSEKVTGLDWSELVAREVLEPLKMKSSGFSPPQAGKAELEQPVGHRRIFGFTSAAAPTADLSPILAPAGRLYMTLGDLAIYANDHLQGQLGEGALLQTETYRRLHSPVMGEYGYGWVTKPAEDWSQGAMLWHNGSNRLWHALMVLVPESRTIVLVASNDGNVSVAEKNAWEIVRIAIASLTESANQ